MKKTKKTKEGNEEDRMKRNKSKGDTVHISKPVGLWSMSMVQISSFSSFKLVLLYEPS